MFNPNDFNNFLSSQEQVPQELSQSVQKKISTLLNPNPWITFGKLFLIHTIVGILSLAVCHQFGVNPFGTSFSLSDWFMDMGGHGFCMAACGFFFIGGSLLVAGYLLTIEELKALKRHEFIQTLSLSLISLGLLFAVGAELALGIVLFWLFGAFLGGFLATHGVLKFHRLVYRQP